MKAAFTAIVLAAATSHAGLFDDGWSTTGARPAGIGDVTLIGMGGFPISDVSATYTASEIFTVGGRLGVQTQSGLLPVAERWSVHGHVRIGTPSEKLHGFLSILENLLSASLQLEPGYVTARASNGVFIPGLTVPVKLRGALNTGIVNFEVWVASAVTWLKAVEVPVTAGFVFEWVLSPRLAFLLKLEGGGVWSEQKYSGLVLFAGGLAWRSSSHLGNE